MKNCLATLFATLATFLFASAAAAETPGLQLLAKDSLAGWQYGDDLAGWTIHDGVLTGSAAASPLVGGWTLGDFELDIAFTTPKASAIELKFSTVDDQDNSNAIYCGSKETEIKNGRLHIKRRAGELSYEFDEGQNGRSSVDPQTRLGISLSVLGKQATISSITLREPAGAPIFNEKDLSGWWTPGKADAWKVEGNELVKRGGGGNYLRTKKEYGNFVLSLEYKISKGGNSGIGIRTKPNGWPSGDGMELQLLDKPNVDKSSTMAIYRNVPPLAAAHKSEDWNHAVVRAEGFVISAWVNGELVQHANTLRHPELKHRNLSGWIGFQDHGGVDQFRNIRLFELPAGRGLEQWNTPVTPTAVELVLDRILNYETLAKQDNTRSHYVGTSTNGEPRQPLAKFTGPGALVRIGFDRPDVKLAFYFDGEKTPRLQCKAGDMAKKFPKLTQAAQPCLTCVAFSKELRIEAEDAKAGATFDFASVAFGIDVEITTFEDRERSMPQGWLDTIDYRHHHHRFGTHREADPLPRQQSAKTKIEPGSAAPLLKLEGAGVVQWLKIEGLKNSLLENDDLWLEITVDGEANPAILAPARYLMAMVQDGQNYNNLLMLYRDGFTSRLAMPFANGISVVAHNKGKNPIGPVGASVSYRPERDAAAMADWARLRGRYVAGHDRSEPYDIAILGRGRLVGIVASGTEQGSLGIEGVIADRAMIRSFSDNSPPTPIGFPVGKKGKQSSLGYLSGTAHGLAWRYPLLAPIHFDEKLQIRCLSQADRQHLVLYYSAVEK